MLDSTHLKAHRTAASLLKKGILYVLSFSKKEAWIPNFMPFVTAMGGLCWLKDRSATTRVQPSSSISSPITARFWQTEATTRRGCVNLWRQEEGWLSACHPEKPEMKHFPLTTRCIINGILLKIHSANWRTGGTSRLGMTAVPIPFSQPSVLFSPLSFILINEYCP